MLTLQKCRLVFYHGTVVWRHSASLQMLLNNWLIIPILRL